MKKISLYFSFCIFIRLSLILIIYYTLQFHKLWTGLLLIMGLGFLFQYITKYRKKGAFNQNIWWDFLRPFHSITHLYSAYLIYNKNTNFVYVLLLDVIVGVLFHIKYRI